jgi:hypothetical protein
MQYVPRKKKNWRRTTKLKFLVSQKPQIIYSPAWRYYPWIPIDKENGTQARLLFLGLRQLAASLVDANVLEEHATSNFMV